MKVSLINQQRHAQAGQAMTEALIACTFFAVLIFSVRFTDQIQQNAILALLKSSKNVFEISSGRSYEDQLHVETIGTDAVNPYFKVDPLASELLLEKPGFVQSGVSIKNDYSDRFTLGRFALQRYSFIEAGNGYASSDQEVQKRIAQSPRAWGGAEQVSVRSMVPIESFTALTERAWKRPRLSVDFLQPWAGVIPVKSERLNVNSHRE